MRLSGENADDLFVLACQLMNSQTAFLAWLCWIVQCSTFEAVALYKLSAQRAYSLHVEDVYCIMEHFSKLIIWTVLKPMLTCCLMRSWKDIRSYLIRRCSDFFRILIFNRSLVNKCKKNSIGKRLPLEYLQDLIQACTKNKKGRKWSCQRKGTLMFSVSVSCFFTCCIEYCLIIIIIMMMMVVVMVMMIIMMMIRNWLRWHIIAGILGHLTIER